MYDDFKNSIIYQGSRKIIMSVNNMSWKLYKIELSH